jgi:hypothetical protein
LVALSSALPALDVAVSLGMKLNSAAHTDFVTEFTVRLRDDRVEVPVGIDFDLFKDVDAIFVP